MTESPSIETTADTPGFAHLRVGAQPLADVSQALGALLASISDGEAALLDLNDVHAASGDHDVDTFVHELRSAAERGVIMVIAAPDEKVRMELNCFDVDRIAPVRETVADAAIILHRMISI